MAGVKWVPEARPPPIMTNASGNHTHLRKAAASYTRAYAAFRHNAAMSAPLTLLLNGRPETLPGPISLHALLAQQGLVERRVAVELDGEVVPRSRWAQVWLEEGQRLEIIQAVGGG